MAFLIDGLIGFAIAQSIFSALGHELFYLDRDVPLAARAVTISWAAVYNIAPVVIWGGTPGKLLLGLYIGTESGDRVSLWTAALRHVAASNFYISSIIFEFDRSGVVGTINALVYMVSIFMLLSDTEQRRALHDRIARTRVLQGSALRHGSQPSLDSL